MATQLDIDASEQTCRHLTPLEHNANPQAHEKRGNEQYDDYRHRRNAGYVNKAQQNPVDLLMEQVHPEAVPLEQAFAHPPYQPLSMPENRKERKRPQKPQDEQQDLRCRPESTPPEALQTNHAANSMTSAMSSNEGLIRQKRDVSTRLSHTPNKKHGK